MPTFYQIAHYQNNRVRKLLKQNNLPDNTRLSTIKGIKTGEFRNPKKGEWFLSGAIPEVYYAFSDLYVSYDIVCLVITKETTIESVDRTLSHQ